MTLHSTRIPVVDLFAGPGGLGEGFYAHKYRNRRVYEVSLAVESDNYAYETLLLRTFYRFHCYDGRRVPESYYAFLRREITRDELFRHHSKGYDYANSIASLITLGIPGTDKWIDSRIRAISDGLPLWILVGGPPCQAYSIVGRSRSGGLKESDPRVHLFKSYLRVLASHLPPVFVMENVKGLISARLNGDSVFEMILQDLQDPRNAIDSLFRGKSNRRRNSTYTIHSLVTEPKPDLFGNHHYGPSDYIIKCERYGIPQTRHRVILIGLRNDLDVSTLEHLEETGETATVKSVIGTLPKLRSGLSDTPDSLEGWRFVLKEIENSSWLARMRDSSVDTESSVATEILKSIRYLPRHLTRGGEFIPFAIDCSYKPEWYVDSRLNGACNHCARTHMRQDLSRYLYASCFARVHDRSPNLNEYPRELLPAHNNVSSNGHAKVFVDRFKVQTSKREASTITSHISKDGHYFIHYDPRQCRSLTVREAARLQTFPDNYLFCGPRTSQYVQVGNAVPPLLAKQIAATVYRILVP